MTRIILRFYEPVHAAPVKSAVTIVSAQIATAEGTVTGHSVECPAGTMPLSGGVSGVRESVLTLRSRPHGRTWQFRLLSPNGSGQGPVGVSVVCLHGPVRTVSRTIQSGASGARLSCPRGYSGATVGWSYVPPDDAFDGFLGWELKSFSPAWRIRADDLASDSHSTSGPLQLTSTCAHGSFRTLSFTDSLAKGERIVQHRCPAGRIPVGGGFTIGGSQFFDAFAVVSTSTARWSFYNQLKHAKVKTSIVCMS